MISFFFYVHSSVSIFFEFVSLTWSGFVFMLLYCIVQLLPLSPSPKDRNGNKSMGFRVFISSSSIIQSIGQSNVIIIRPERVMGGGGSLSSYLQPLEGTSALRGRRGGARRSWRRTAAGPCPLCIYHTLIPLL